jgi:hypothetical protein
MLGFSKRQREPDELTGDDEIGPRGNKVRILSDGCHDILLKQGQSAAYPIHVALFLACKSSTLQLLIAARPDTTPSSLAHLAR